MIRAFFGVFFGGLVLLAPLPLQAAEVRSVKPQPDPREDRLGVGRLVPARARPHLAPFASKISKLHVKPGARVRKGSALVTLRRLDPSRDFSDFTVVSNAEGLVSEVFFPEGADVSASTVLVSLVSSDRWESEVWVSDKKIHRVRPGMRASAWLLEKALGKKTAQVEVPSLPARVVAVAPRPAEGTGLYAVRFEIELSRAQAESSVTSWLGQLVTFSQQTSK